ncbi:MAG: FecR family protein, partial [Rhodospirillales bacterium]|nr:FecR family protein [Rhodospirillales bacterium]
MTDDPQNTPTDDPFEPLFAGVERRPQPSDAARERAFDAITEEWEALQTRRRKNRWRGPMALAATVLVGILGLTLLRQPATSTLMLELAQGHIRVDGADHRAVHDPISVALGKDTRVKALGPGRWVAPNGADVRVSTGTEFMWRGEGTVALRYGQVYVATDGGASFTVETPQGRVTDIGTRFLVATRGGGLEAAAREGQIELATPVETQRTKPVRTGYAALLVTDGEGRIVQRTEPASHQRWNWIHTAPKGYTTRNPVAMLREIANDLGKAVHFDKGVEAALGAEELDGNYRGMAPWAAL